MVEKSRSLIRTVIDPPYRKLSRAAPHISVFSAKLTLFMKRSCRYTNPCFVWRDGVGNTSPSTDYGIITYHNRIFFCTVNNYSACAYVNSFTKVHPPGNMHTGRQRCISSHDNIMPYRTI